MKIELDSKDEILLEFEEFNLNEFELSVLNHSCVDFGLLIMAFENNYFYIRDFKPHETSIIAISCLSELSDIEFNEVKNIIYAFIDDYNEREKKEAKKYKTISKTGEIFNITKIGSNVIKIECKIDYETNAVSMDIIEEVSQVIRIKEGYLVADDFDFDTLLNLMQSTTKVEKKEEVSIRKDIRILLDKEYFYLWLFEAYFNPSLIFLEKLHRFLSLEIETQLGRKIRWDRVVIPINSDDTIKYDKGRKYFYLDSSLLGHGEIQMKLIWWSDSQGVDLDIKKHREEDHINFSLNSNINYESKEFDSKLLYDFRSIFNIDCSFSIYSSVSYISIDSTYYLELLDVEQYDLVAEVFKEIESKWENEHSSDFEMSSIFIIGLNKNHVVFDLRNDRFNSSDDDEVTEIKFIFEEIEKSDLQVKAVNIY
jgi:hypothetical protein